MMDFALPAAGVLGGIMLLLASGEGMVKHAAHLASTYRVPKVVVGALVLGFGTSAPELFVSLTAVLRGDPGIAIGNVVGSNIANTGLILGLGALLAGFRMERRVIRVDLPLTVLAALLLWAYLGRTHEVTRIAALCLLLAFLVYLLGSLRYVRESRAGGERPARVERHLLRDLLWMVAGLAGIAAGAQLLVRGAAEIARLLEVSELVIGLSVVALGTSLPELATLLAALRRGEGDLAVGNIAGSNIFNLLFILGTASMVRPIPIEDVMLRLDLPALAVFAVLTFPLFARGRRIGRGQGLVLLACYAGYWAWRILG